MLSICCKLAWLQFLLKFCNMIKVPSHELFPNPPRSKYINKFCSPRWCWWCVSNKMLCEGRNIYRAGISGRGPPGASRSTRLAAGGWEIDLNIQLILPLCEATPTKDFLTQWEGFYKHAESFVRQMTTGAVLHFFDSEKTFNVLLIVNYSNHLGRRLLELTGHI